MKQATALAVFTIARDDNGDLAIFVDGVTTAFKEEHSKLSVQPTWLDYAQILIIEAAGRLAAQGRTVPGAHLRPVN